MPAARWVDPFAEAVAGYEHALIQSSGGVWTLHLSPIRPKTPLFPQATVSDKLSHAGSPQDICSEMTELLAPVRE